MIRSIRKIGILAFALTFLSGCGFHLRGMGSDQIALASINVSAANVHGSMQSMLERALTEAGVKLVPAAGAPYAVRILTEHSTRRAVATTNEVQVAQYKLELTVQFELDGAGGKQIIPPSNVSAERTYQFDNTSLMGNSEEENLLDQEMRRDAASQIIRRIDATIRAAQGKRQ